MSQHNTIDKIKFYKSGTTYSFITLKYSKVTDSVADPVQFLDPDSRIRF